MSVSPSRFLDATTPPTTFTLLTLTGIGAMAMNVFLPALPQMAEEFGTEYSVIQLSVGLYLALVAASQIVLGPLADRFGRRKVLLGAFATFAVASLGCAIATDVVWFLAFRALQAAVYSGIVLARAIVRDTSGEAQAASKIGYLTMGMAMVPMVAPALGGWMEHTMGWRSIFWMMSGLGTVWLWLIWRDLGETRFSSFGSLSEQLRSYPDLLRSAPFWGYVATMSSAGGTFFVYLGGVPFVGSNVFGLTPGVLGMLFGVTSFGYATGSFLSGRLSVSRGVRRMILSGTCVTALSLSLNLGLFLAGLGSVASFFGLMILMGVGYGMTLPNATAGSLSVKPKLAGTASGLGGTIMIGIGAALSSLAGTVMVGDAGVERLLSIQLVIALVGVVVAVWLLRLPSRSGE